MGFTLNLKGAGAEDMGTERNSKNQDVMFTRENGPQEFGVDGWAGLAGEDDRPTCMMGFRRAE